MFWFKKALTHLCHWVFILPLVRADSIGIRFGTKADEFCLNMMAELLEIALNIRGRGGDSPSKKKVEKVEKFKGEKLLNICSCSSGSLSTYEAEIGMLQLKKDCLDFPE